MWTLNSHSAVWGEIQGTAVLQEPLGNFPHVGLPASDHFLCIGRPLPKEGLTRRQPQRCTGFTRKVYGREQTVTQAKPLKSSQNTTELGEKCLVIPPGQGKYLELESLPSGGGTVTHRLNVRGFVFSSNSVRKLSQYNTGRNNELHDYATDADCM